MNREVKINKNKLYIDGILYGIDLSSAFAVKSMGLENIKARIGEEQIEVLDMCCAPGAKFSYIADILVNKYNDCKFRLSGVDISENRINICRNIAQKYGHVSDKHHIFNII